MIHTYFGTGWSRTTNERHVVIYQNMSKNDVQKIWEVKNCVKIVKNWEGMLQYLQSLVLCVMRLEEGVP